MPSRYAAEPTEDEETTTASSEYSEDDEYSLLGSLKTQVQWDAADKQLGVTLRQSVQTARKVRGSVSCVHCKHWAIACHCAVLQGWLPRVRPACRLRAACRHLLCNAQSVPLHLPCLLCLLQIELKYKGHLNTGTGDYHTHGYLRKNFNTNTPSLQVGQSTLGHDLRA